MGAKADTLPRVGRLEAFMRSRWAALLAALPGVAVVCVHFSAVRPAFVDDSYIFYRYAANWGDGLGLVFNRGEHVTLSDCMQPGSSGVALQQ